MGSISGSVDVDITGGGNPLPFALVTETVTAADESGNAVFTTTGSADLGTVKNALTLAVGISALSFSPSFATVVTAAQAVSAEQEGDPLIPFPIPVGSLSVALQGSLDNESWYDLTGVSEAFASSDGATLPVTLSTTLTATTSGIPLVRYIQAVVTLTLTGNTTLVVHNSSDYNELAYSEPVQVTSLQATLSVYAAADLNG